MRLDKKVYDKDLKEKIKERIAGKVDVQLGKNGITDGFINEVRNRLEKHKVVKIRVLRSFRKTYTDDVEYIAKLISEKTGAKILEIRGFTITLIKEK